jgi:hypothetical protein
MTIPTTMSTIMAMGTLMQATTTAAVGTLDIVTRAITISMA